MLLYTLYYTPNWPVKVVISDKCHIFGKLDRLMRKGYTDDRYSVPQCCLHCPSGRKGRMMRAAPKAMLAATDPVDLSYQEDYQWKAFVEL